MPIIKLKAGETVLVAAVNPDLVIGGGPMPGGGGPVDPGYGIDIGLGVPSHPIVLPPDPTQPLPIDPGWSGGVAPPGQEGGAPKPTHPIVLPPPGEIPPPIEPPTTPTPGWEVKIAWTPTTGWVVVAVPTGPHVTPSKKR
jgi:hypothetical protein